MQQDGLHPSEPGGKRLDLSEIWVFLRDEVQGDREALSWLNSSRQQQRCSEFFPRCSWDKKYWIKCAPSQLEICTDQATDQPGQLYLLPASSPHRPADRGERRQLPQQGLAVQKGPGLPDNPPALPLLPRPCHPKEPRHPFPAPGGGHVTSASPGSGSVCNTLPPVGSLGVESGWGL